MEMISPQMGDAWEYLVICLAVESILKYGKRRARRFFDSIMDILVILGLPSCGIPSTPG
jgi:hypothetical protein